MAALSIGVDHNYNGVARPTNILDPAAAQDAVTLAYLQRYAPIISNRRYRTFSAFLTTANTFPFASANSGGTITAPADATLPHGVALSRGTTAANRAAIASSQGMFHFNMVTRIFTEYWIKIRTAVPDATNNYVIQFGFHDGTTADPTDGAYWAFQIANSATNWLCVTANNNTRTIVDSGIAATLNVWFKLGVEVLDVGGGVRNARFYNSTPLSDAPPTLVQTITTNIPTAAGRETGAAYLLRGIAGTADRQVGIGNVLYDVEY